MKSEHSNFRQFLKKHIGIFVVALIGILLATNQLGFISLTKPFSRAATTITLQHVGSTPIEIVLSWTQIPEVASYKLQRSTDWKFSSIEAEYSFPPSILGFGDTGHNPTTPY